MTSKGLARSVVTGSISGYVGTKVMTLATTKVEQLQSDQDKAREKEVSPGVAYNIAAEKIAGFVGVRFSERQVSSGGTLLHNGTGISAGELYMLLRRRTSLKPVTAGILVGLAIWAIVDEGMNPLFGFSASFSEYPLSTHVRGLSGHLALGLGTAATAESLSWLGSGHYRWIMTDQSEFSDCK